MQSDTKYSEELKSTNATAEQMHATNRNDDLMDLLNEAKSTILELQREIESQKFEIEQLRQQNHNLASKNDLSQNQSNLKTAQDYTEIDSGRNELKPASTTAMPLEPAVVVVVANDDKIESSTNANLKATDPNDGMPKAKIIHSNPKYVARNVVNRLTSDQTSQSDDTFVV